MYEILKSFNETTKLSINSDKIYVLKKIFVEDIEMYKKLSKISNENVIRIYETTLIENEFYAVEEFVQGVTLEKYLSEKGNLSDALTCELIKQLCNGLKAIHDIGIVHRDINPNNIMIDENNTLKIIDFGISRIKKNGKTTDTHLLGTYGFAPPEQYGFSQTGFEADIYSIGVLINYMKTGCLVNEKIDKGVFYPIITKCTQIDKANRYKNTEELVSNLDKKYKIKKIIRSIPGFRQGKWWHEVIAILYFLVVILMYVTFKSEGAKSRINDYIVVTLFFVAPVPVLTNFGDWLNNFELTRNMKKSSQRVLQIAIAAVFVIASFFFM